MGDGISVKFFTKELTRGLKDMERRVDRATMWGLREVGRALKTSARKRAPVYRGRDVRAQSGRLKKSISSSRRLKKVGPHTYSLTVGPRGEVVHLYAMKEEDRVRFMKDAYDEIVPMVPTIFNRAWAKAMKR